MNLTTQPSGAELGALTQATDALLEELEESIPQGVANSTHFDLGRVDLKSRDDDSLAGLDDLLKDSLTIAEAEAQYKKDREARRKGYAGLSKEEVEFCNSRMHAFEMAREWDVEEAYAVFQQVTCTACDTTRIVFSRLMERHQHRRVATTKRWLAVATTKAPMRSALENVEVPMCMDCAPGFDLQIDESTPWLEDLINPGGQEQDDERE